MIVQKEINAKFVAIVARVGELNASDVTAEKSFIEDLDIDSLAMVEISTQVEDELSITIPDDKLYEMKTVGDFNDFIAELV